MQARVKTHKKIVSGILSFNSVGVMPPGHWAYAEEMTASRARDGAPCELRGAVPTGVVSPIESRKPPES